MKATLLVESKIPKQLGLHTLRDLNLSKVTAVDVIEKLSEIHKIAVGKLALQVEDKQLKHGDKKSAEPLKKTVGGKPPRLYLKLIKDDDSSSESSTFKIPIVAVHKSSSAQSIKTPPTPPYMKTASSQSLKKKIESGAVGRNFKQPNPKPKERSEPDVSSPKQPEQPKSDKKDKKGPPSPEEKAKDVKEESKKASFSKPITTPSEVLVKQPPTPIRRVATKESTTTTMSENSKPALGTVRSMRSMSPESSHRVTVDLLVDERGVGCFGIKVPIEKPKTKQPPASPPPTISKGCGARYVLEDHLPNKSKRSGSTSSSSSSSSKRVSALSTPPRETKSVTVCNSCGKDMDGDKVTMDAVINARAPKKEAWVPSGQAPLYEINKITQRRVAARYYPSPKVRRSRSLTKGTQTTQTETKVKSTPRLPAGFIPCCEYEGMRDGYYFGYECNQLGYIPLSAPVATMKKSFEVVSPTITNSLVDACYEEADELFPIP